MLWLSLRLKASIEEFDSEYLKPETPCQKTLKPNLYTVEARKLEHHYPHALKVKYKGS